MTSFRAMASVIMAAPPRRVNWRPPAAGSPAHWDASLNLAFVGGYSL